ncbi:MAG: biotin transporter BioY [Spirochaetaceae bacterium]|jgi:biotin transport system substrate-specific component|nr:biotin transporter BioY [Spirochaetaceae bacterium]
MVHDLNLSAKTRVRGGAASRQGVFVALFAALICVSSFWMVPFIPGIPIVLKNLVVVLAGVLLGRWRGAAAAALYLLAGLLGLPVFANAGGFAAFLSPSGGYLYGYVVAALVAGLIAGTPSIRDKKPSFCYGLRIVTALLAGFLVINVCGGLWLVILNGKSAAPQPAVGVFLGGIVPFIPADGIKFALAIPITFALRPLAARYINPGS